MKNWIATYYRKNGTIISAIKISDRTEHEATNEAMAQIPINCFDWTLMEDIFFNE